MEKQIKIEYQSGYLLCERRNPINGEYWVYISPKEWQTKEDIIPTKANHPIGWFDKLHDKENYYTIVGTFVNGYAFEQALSKAEDKGEMKCSSCSGFGYAGEYEFVYKCKRCNGTGKEKAIPQPTNSLDELERWVNENVIEVQTELNTFNVIEVSELLTKIQELKTITT